MIQPLKDDNARLEVRRLLPASREKVFDAWTRPDRMRQWFAPGPMSCPRVEVDLRPGGAYRIEMQEPGGATRVTHGTYREVVPNERLVFTWGWEGPDRHETLVTVELRSRGEDTELVLVHERFASAESREQ
ncbi:MAG: SRPBCC domain-containing protein, partial [Myxococcaceae bacterium]|nr:SRPBCC domain-containing protein [Myxococcaceae bacterium]